MTGNPEKRDQTSDTRKPDAAAIVAELQKRFGTRPDPPHRAGSAWHPPGRQPKPVTTGWRR